MEGLFSLGSNGSGQLGIGHMEDTSVPKPVQFSAAATTAFDPHDDPIVKVAAGGNHTILVSSSGKAFWSGDASTGACGEAVSREQGVDSDAAPRTEFHPLILMPGPPTSSSSPVDADDIARQQNRSKVGPIVHVACTWDCTVLVLQDTEHGGKATKVCVSGNSPVGSASEARPDLVQWLPDFPPRGTQVVGLASGFRHVVAVLDNGEAWGWGHNRKGQLGYDYSAVEPPNVSSPASVSPSETQQQKQQAILNSPRKIPLDSRSAAAGDDFKVHAAVCCQYTTVLLAPPGDGRIRVLGADKWGLVHDAPSAVPQWKSMSAGWGCVYILTYDGNVVSWGRDDHGQRPPRDLPALVALSAGSEHCVAVTEDGWLANGQSGGTAARMLARPTPRDRRQQVIAWGWGEHGNCGPWTDMAAEGVGSGDVKGRWNVLASLASLPEGSEFTFVGAGCATSWVNVRCSQGIFL